MKVAGWDYFGTAALVGYTDYDGKDVAVLQMSASVSLDVAGVAYYAKNGIKIKGGVMNGHMYWDMEHNFARWIAMTVRTTMEMEDPYYASKFIEIPAKEVFVMYATV